jgi:glycosyltransferase involved in cell wall biosynthesis
MLKISIITVTKDRPHLLVNAIASLESQTNKDFEWIIINDGGDDETRNIIFDREASPVGNRSLNFPYTYLDLIQPSHQGFALCYGRNRGLIMSEGDLITYLDDDNTFTPNFVEEMIGFFERYPHLNYAMPIQHRRRDLIKDGVVKKGKEFDSPTPDCTLTEFITHRQLIDSNGFTHKPNDNLTWNPNLKIYIDYEFFLKCVSY